ncbi:MAG TPA: LOG family protein [Anaerolineae bacterium]|nr:LOG family protein [Anaerolineae bacterium]
MSHSAGPIAVVFGSNSPQVGDFDYEQARELGCLLAQAGYVVATGGYFGTMEAASRGAKEAGGHVVGVTTSLFDEVRLHPNAYLDEEIKFPTLFQRLHHLVTMADAWVALPGGIGTLSEVALTWSLLQVGEVKRQPFVLVGEMWHATIERFSNDRYVRTAYRELVKYADTIQDVLAQLK